MSAQNSCYAQDRHLLSFVYRCFSCMGMSLQIFQRMFGFLTVLCTTLVLGICNAVKLLYMYLGPSWSWSYGSWIYNYMCNQCLSPPSLWFRISLSRGLLDTTLCDKDCHYQWLTAGRWFSTGTPDSSCNKTYIYDITELLLKVGFSTINIILNIFCCRTKQKNKH